MGEYVGQARFGNDNVGGYDTKAGIMRWRNHVGQSTDNIQAFGA